MGSFHCSVGAEDSGSRHNLQAQGQNTVGGTADCLLEVKTEKRGESLARGLE